MSDHLLALNDGERRISDSIYHQYLGRERVLQGDVVSDKYFILGRRNNHVHNNTLARLQRLLVVAVAAEHELWAIKARIINLEAAAYAALVAGLARNEWPL